MDTPDEETRRKPGPLPGPPMKTYTINIEESDAEWAKRQPGGMAAFVRGKIREARQAEEKRSKR